MRAAEFDHLVGEYRGASESLYAREESTRVSWHLEEVAYIAYVAVAEGLTQASVVAAVACGLQEFAERGK